MPKSQLPPWHKVVRLKDELRTGELTLAEFAADLHEVTLGLGKRPIYEDPERFFALTYPTVALRDLVKDVAYRLAGQSAKAVRQLELTYGGGKTHTLITLYHLFRNPSGIADLPAVKEFRQHMDIDLPKAFPVSLCFDKIDVEAGIENVRGPNGETRTLKHPWSVLAFQIAGSNGLRAIHADGDDIERDTPPAEPLLVKLLELPQQEDLATLILVDEVLMYARGKAGIDPAWRGRIVDFFQYLVQAVTKVDRAAMVASLLATDPAKADNLGQKVQSDLFDIFRRQREEGVLPVSREDVAAVLRRRFFEPGSIADPNTYRAHVIGVVRALADLDETTKKNRREEEARFHASFPFHPDLTDVFYSRWTQLAGFQRTRGMLRTLATGMRDAEPWDTCPVIGPAALLATPDKTGISDAVADLAGIATSEPSEGSKTDWRTLLEAELLKARQIQDEIPTLRGREAEQAVIGVFLYSQPIGHKANTPELIKMIGAGGVGAIDLDKGLARWRDLSWFLDDADMSPDDAPGELPKSWRLGNRPNLKQMHDEACSQRVTTAQVEDRLAHQITETRALAASASAAGARVHRLPTSPADLPDNGDFCYAILGPAAASDSGKPSALARRFVDETTGPDKPRVNRNAVVLAVPSRDGIAAARDAVRSLLGWQDVSAQLRQHAVDPLQGERLRRRLSDAQTVLQDTVRAAWCVVVTVNEQDEVHAFKLAASGEPLFVQIKNDERSRIKDTAIDAGALAPDGPYGLWRDDDDSRYVSELANAFARYPRLPKMLKPSVVLDTICQGVKRGIFVARLGRPDGSIRTWWREDLSSVIAEDPQLQVVLPEKAELVSLPPAILAPDQLPGLWTDGLSFRDVVAYFNGGHSVTVERDGYEDTEFIPKCDVNIVRTAVADHVSSGLIWLTNGPTSIWDESVPGDALDDNARLRPRPASLSLQDLTEDNLPGAWRDGHTTGADLERAVSQSRGEAMPWGLIREAIQASVSGRWLEVRDGSHGLGGEWQDAANILLQKPSRIDIPPPIEPKARAATLECHDIQELADIVPELMAASAGHSLRFEVRVLLDDAPDEVRSAVDTLLTSMAVDLRSNTASS